MLQDPMLDALIDAFESGFSDADTRSPGALSCPFNAKDNILSVAWQDGVHWNATHGTHASGESWSLTPAVDDSSVGVWAPFRHPFVLLSPTAGTPPK